MARWRLTQPVYLRVPGTMWVHSEVSNKGRQINKAMDVPLHLDPKVESDFSHPGMIVVAHEGSSDPDDWVFTGDPTPDMEPLDEEARAITERLRPNWIKSAEIGAGFTENLMENFARQIAAIQSTAQPSTQTGDLERLEKRLEDQARELALLKAGRPDLVPERRV